MSSPKPQKSSTRSSKPSGKRSDAPSDLPQIPSPPPLSHSDWEKPVSSDVLDAALFRLSLELEPEIVEHELRFAALKDRLAQRDYALAEIQFAVDRLSDDPDLVEHLRYPDTHLSAGDFRKVIEPLRKIRSKLKGEALGSKKYSHQGERDEKFRPLTEDEVERAVEMIPELTFEDFGTRAGDNDRDKYMLHAEKRRKLFGE